MSLLNFKPVPTPRGKLQQFELCIGAIGTSLMWPTQRVQAFVDGDISAYGLDVEAEEFQALAERLAAEWPPYAMNLPMTRLEIIVAHGEAKAKLPPKGVMSSRP